jgi:hypothetical protein
MKPLKKCVILLKMNKNEGPNTVSFAKKAYSTRMDGMMILIMMPLLLMILLPWKVFFRTFGLRPSSMSQSEFVISNKLILLGLLLGAFVLQRS